MTSKLNKNIVRDFYNAFGANDQEALKELLSSELAAYSHGTPGPQNRDLHLQNISGWNAAFKTRYTIEEQIAEGDLVATRVTMHATHNGNEFMGVKPSGKQVVTQAITIERIKDGQIVERRVSADWLEMMQQLGLTPAP